ncbi:MAG: hypothetical protein KA715_04830 [Xanthomonadaceae bacterium]|nr:hypothetical protein [Xanthomonadaceae bacterium]
MPKLCGSHSSSVTSDCEPEFLLDDGSVWRVGSRRWNADYEKQFSDWLSTQINDKVFYEVNMSTDCADAVFVLRAIFSRIHHLPFVIHPDPYHGKVTFHQGWKNWADIPTERGERNWTLSNWRERAKTDKRFRKFAEHFRYYFTTLDIPHNTYPTQLFNEEEKTLSSNLRVGSVIFWGSHIGTIFKIDIQCRSPIVFRDSHVPAAVRDFTAVPSAGDLFTSEWHETDGSGYLNWSWDVNCAGKWKKIPDESMPGYSLQQFSSKLATVRDWLSENVGRLLPDFNYYGQNLKHLTEYFKFRAALVDEAVRLIPTKLAELQDPKTFLYEAYSTPSRDKKGCEKINQLSVDTLEPDSEIRTGEWYDLLNQVIITKFKFEFKTYSISLGDMMQLCTQFSPFSSDPADSHDLRWDLKRVLKLRSEGGAKIDNPARGIRAVSVVNSSGKLSWIEVAIPVKP